MENNILISTNPAKNYEKIGEVRISSKEEILEKVDAANKAKLLWKEIPIDERIKYVQKYIEEIEKRKEGVSNLITCETGKLISEANDEVEAFLSDSKWYVKNSKSILEDEITHEDDESIHKIVREPYGCAAVITPWNFPLGVSADGIIPNLLSGNTIVFKISEECPLIGKIIEESSQAANFPRGVFNVIHGRGNEGSILCNSDVNLICFTGSSKVGEELYKLAAQKFIPAVLEMGGSSPCVIFDDVDSDKAVEALYFGRFFTNGQVCDALKRAIVHESLAEEFIQKMKEFVEKQVVGDPQNESTTLSSLVAQRQQTLLKSQVDDALEKGATLITGGKIPENIQGAYFEPTILTNITKDMKVWHEETFGPVLPIVTFKTEEEAIDLANDTIYGLGAKVLSNDLERAKRVASKIDAGTVEINYGNRWISCNPFGGYKKSGMGRVIGKEGFRNFTQIKLISQSK